MNIRRLRPLRLVLSLTGLAAGMSASNAQASCPSYPIGLCTTAGFCVRVDTLADANQSTDNPAAQLVQSATPTFATRMAMAGTADLDADSSVVASGADGEEALGSVRLDLSGAICNTGTLVSFSGSRAFRDLDPLVGDSTREYTTSIGMLVDVPLVARTEFSAGPFTAPTGEALQLELRSAQGLTASASGGSGHRRQPAARSVKAPARPDERASDRANGP